MFCLLEKTPKKLFERTMITYSNFSRRPTSWRLKEEFEGTWEPVKQSRVALDFFDQAFKLNGPPTIETDMNGRFSVDVFTNNNLVFFEKELKLNNELINFIKNSDLDPVPVKKNIFSVKAKGIEKKIAFEFIDMRNALKTIALSVFNKTMCSVVVDVQNIDSHTTINNVEVEIIGNNIPKYDIVNKYIDYRPAINDIVFLFPNYISGYGKFYSGANKDINYIYPGSYTVKLKHPDYFYSEEKINITSGEINKVFYMSELGKKQRVINVNH